MPTDWDHVATRPVRGDDAELERINREREKESEQQAEKDWERLHPVTKIQIHAIWDHYHQLNWLFADLRRGLVEVYRHLRLHPGRELDDREERPEPEEPPGDYQDIVKRLVEREAKEALCETSEKGLGAAVRSAVQKLLHTNVAQLVSDQFQPRISSSHTTRLSNAVEQEVNAYLQEKDDEIKALVRQLCDAELKSVRKSLLKTGKQKVRYAIGDRFERDIVQVATEIARGLRREIVQTAIAEFIERDMPWVGKYIAAERLGLTIEAKLDESDREKK